MAHACKAYGIDCDTDYQASTEMSIEAIYSMALGIAPFCKSIIWTGGEPTDQLDYDHVQYFHDFGYYQAIETSGVRLPPHNINWVSLSPKLNFQPLKKVWVDRPPNEVRCVVKAPDQPPALPFHIEHQFLSPHSDGAELNRENMDHCIQLVKDNPEWRLSIQQHKVWRVR